MSQVTTTSDDSNLFPSVDARGEHIVFQSSADLVPGGNEDGSAEVFLYQVATGTFEQLTDSGDLGAFRPVLAGSGEAVAFLSTADLVPGQNLDGSDEVFLLVRGEGLQQITDQAGFPSVNGPSIDTSGSRVAFSSKGDPVPGENVDGSREVFLWDAAEGLRQVTSDGVGTTSSAAWISGDGRRIVFRSDGDLVPPRNADGSDEIFVWDQVTGLLQVTSDLGGTFLLRPVTDHRGRRIAFASDGDPFGRNPDGFTEIFLHDDGIEIRQVTERAVPSEPMGLSGDGSRILLISFAEHEPGDLAAASVELFFLEVGTGELTQLTDDPPAIFDFRGGDLSANGQRVAFFSLRDHLPGQNPEGNPEIFLLDCAAGGVVSVPASSAVPRLLLAGALVAAGLLLLSRRP